MYRHLFGPVPSRRLGMSLGIDLVPHKVCTFNCVYCECGRTTQLTVRRSEYVPVDEVRAELASYLAHNPEPDAVTFSGAGEPTLNSRLGEVLRFLQAQRNEARITVLTNASLLSDPQVRAELRAADLVVPSLDAASERTFRHLDRPSPRVRLSAYLQGLADLRAEHPGAMWLEVMILPGYNDNPEDVRRLGEALAWIAPERIQLNTLDRPGAESRLEPASQETLERIADAWGLENVEIVAKAPHPEPGAACRDDPEAAILETIARRPCTAADLGRLLGMSAEAIDRHLARLERAGRIALSEQERGLFYRLAEPHS